VGDQGDAAFLSKALKGADAAYLLVPPKMDAEDLRAYYSIMAGAMVTAVRKSGIKKLVFLSSLGAEQDAGTGPVLGLHDCERALGALKNVDIVFLRAGYFYENLIMNAGLIKKLHINSNPTDADAPVFMVAVRDIAAKVADILATQAFKGHSVVDIFSQRITYREATTALGAGVGMPDLRYVQASAPEAIAAMTGMGLSKSVAEAFVDLAHGISQGKVIPTTLDPAKPNGSMRFDRFVQEVFRPVYESTV
jgi:uncharacterized protein YbjT (DUF2867 family)